MFEEDKFRYNCFNCNYTTGWAEGKYFSSRLKRLMKQFGIEESDIQRLQLELLKEQDVATLLLKQKKRDEPIHRLGKDGIKQPSFKRLCWWRFLIL